MQELNDKKLPGSAANRDACQLVLLQWARGVVRTGRAGDIDSSKFLRCSEKCGKTIRILASYSLACELRLQPGLSPVHASEWFISR